MNSIGANVGTVIGQTVAKEGVVLAKTMRLVGFKVENAPKGNLTMRADDPEKKPYGYILVGPAKGDTLNLRKIRPYSWVMFPVSVGLRYSPAEPVSEERRRNGIIRPPAMVLGSRSRIVCDCPECKYEGLEWSITVNIWSKQMKSAALRGLSREATPKQIADACRDVNNKVRCPKSLKKNPHTATRLGNVDRRLTAIDGDRRADPVFPGYDAPELAEFEAAAESDRALVLPRIWAVYNRNKVPADITGWTPQDEVAEGLEEAIRKKGFELRPYSLAAKTENYKDGLLGFLTDLPADGAMTVGWIAEDELLENKTFGYKVSLMAKRTQEFVI